MAAPFLPIEEKHGPDCTCPAAGRIVIELVAAERACPGDRNPHRAARTAAPLDDFGPQRYPLHDVGSGPLPPHALDAEHHSYPVREPLSVPHQYEPCSCGRRLGETTEHAAVRLGVNPMQ